MYGAVKDELKATLAEIEEAGLYKRERELTTPQSSHVATSGGTSLNFCANNYLGFADHPDVVAASRAALLSRMPSMIDAWLSSSLTIASSAPKSTSKTPPLASKHEL